MENTDKVKVFVLKWKVRGDEEEQTQVFITPEAREMFRLDLETSAVSDVDPDSFKQGFAMVKRGSRALRQAC